MSIPPLFAIAFLPGHEPAPVLQLFPFWRVVFFCVAVAAIYPVGRFLRGHPDVHPWLVALIGFIPFFRVTEVDVTLILTTYTRGEPRGIDATLIDWLAAVLAVCLPAARHPTPYRGVRAVYFAVILASLFFAPRPEYGLLAVWKLARMYFVVRVLGRAFEQARLAPAYLWGIACGLVLQLIVTVGQYYFHLFIWADSVEPGRATGTFHHANNLGAAVGIAAPIVFAVTLARPTRRFSWLAWLAVLAGAVATVLSLSRASIVFFAGSYFLVYFGSLFRRLSGRKLVLALLGTMVVGVVLAVTLQSIVQRFETAPRDSAITRLRMIDAAGRMLQDHPAGIGINQATWMMDEGGYGARVGLRDEVARLVIHNMYWLSAAELGYHGLLVFLLVLAWPLVDAVRGALRQRGDIRGDVLLGCAAGLLATYGHAWFEYMLRTTETMYLFWSVTALVKALVRQLGEPMRPVLAAARSGPAPSRP